MSFTSVPIRGQFVSSPSGGATPQGTVTFTLTTAITDSSTQTTVPATPIVFTLDASGEIPSGSYLTATDDPTTTPQGAYYLVEEQITGNPARYYALNVSRTYASAGIDLGAMDPVPVGGGFDYVLDPIPNGLQIDATAADIQAIGTLAAGSNGKAADSGHIHPINYEAATLSTDVTLATNGTVYTILTTPSLGVGYWEIDCILTLYSGSANTGVESTWAMSSGAATVVGGVASGECSFSAGGYGQLHTHFILHITTAGAVQLQAKMSVNSGAVVKAETQSFVGATGYTAKQVA